MTLEEYERRVMLEVLAGRSCEVCGLGGKRALPNYVRQWPTADVFITPTGAYVDTCRATCPDGHFLTLVEAREVYALWKERQR